MEKERKKEDVCTRRRNFNVKLPEPTHHLSCELCARARVQHHRPFIIQPRELLGSAGSFSLKKKITPSDAISFDYYSFICCYCCCCTCNFGQAISKRRRPGLLLFFEISFFSWFCGQWRAHAHLEFNDILREFVQRWPTNIQLMADGRPRLNIICDGLEILSWAMIECSTPFHWWFLFFFSVSRHRREWRATVTSSCARLLVLCAAFLFFGCGPGRRSIVSAQSRRWASKYILFHYYYYYYY